MDERQINWTIGFAAALGVVLTVASIPLMMNAAFTLSSALGAAIGVGNLWLIRRIVRRSVNATVATGSTRAGGLLLKFAVLAAVVGLIFKFLPIEPLGFMLGFGALVLAAVLGPFFGPDPHADQGAAPSE